MVKYPLCRVGTQAGWGFGRDWALTVQPHGVGDHGGRAVRSGQAQASSLHLRVFQYLVDGQDGRAWHGR
ncbi:MAG: hypothetical protein RI914_1656, partial [Pseudomonadota bacterium]